MRSLIAIALLASATVAQAGGPTNTLNPNTGFGYQETIRYDGSGYNIHTYSSSNRGVCERLAVYYGNDNFEGDDYDFVGGICERDDSGNYTVTVQYVG